MLDYLEYCLEYWWKQKHDILPLIAVAYGEFKGILDSYTQGGSFACAFKVYLGILY